MTNWINTVSRDHVERGVRGRFTQANHGKPNMLRKMARGDWIVFYSPRTDYPKGEPLQAFTAIGQVADDEPYQAEMSDSLQPWRRNVDFLSCTETPIKPLIERARLHRGQEALGIQVPIRGLSDRRPRPRCDPLGDDGIEIRGFQDSIKAWAAVFTRHTSDTSREGARRLITRRPIVTLAAATAILAAGCSQAPSATSPATAAPAAVPVTYAPQIELPMGDFINHLSGLAVDPAGSVYALDFYYGQIWKLAVGTNSPIPLPFEQLGRPDAVAVDARDNLYVVDDLDGQVVKLAPDAFAPTALPFGVGKPSDVAVDAKGNVYVIDENQVLKLAPGNTAPTAMQFAGLEGPSGVAADTEGNIYVADAASRQVLQLETGADKPLILPFTDLAQPTDVTVDTSGNVYVTDFTGDRVLKLSAGAKDPEVLPFAGLNEPSDVATDASGNIYVLDDGNFRVLKLPIK